MISSKPRTNQDIFLFKIKETSSQDSPPPVVEPTSEPVAPADESSVKGQTDTPIEKNTIATDKVRLIREQTGTASIFVFNHNFGYFDFSYILPFAENKYSGKRSHLDF